jgi:DNA-binding Lrp family transcriptional regulator
VAKFDTSYHHKMDSVTFDLLDRQIIQALALDGRAPFSRIAEVLDVSDQTVARRFRRLRTEAGFRIVGTVDPRRVGYDQWYLRLSCTPDAAVEVATALARRSDTAWVDLTSGGTEITCVTHVRSHHERDALLLRRLPHTRQVISVSAHCILEVFNGAKPWSGYDAELSIAQISGLRPPAPLEQGRVELDDGDRKLFEALARDGRTGHGELAEVTGWSESTVRRRIDVLHETGALYYHVDMDTRQLGYQAETNLWMSVPPSELAAVGKEIAGHQEAPFVGATTGPTNLVASVICRDTQDLYRYLTERIGAIGAVHHIETAPVIRTFKRAGTLL